MYDKNIILRKLLKYKPLKYNKFFWLRSYDTGEINISKKSTILEKIKAGYYSFPESYLLQSKLAFIELNEHHPEDIEKIAISNRRYKRLLNDYYKDEEIKLYRIVKDFTKEFLIDEEKIKQVMENFDGDIYELYEYLEKNYKYPLKKTWKRSF